LARVAPVVTNGTDAPVADEPPAPDRAAPEKAAPNDPPLLALSLPPPPPPPPAPALPKVPKVLLPEKSRGNVSRKACCGPCFCAPTNKAKAEKAS
jgi:hypothetical protein